jgi:hypothetical protein
LPVNRSQVNLTSRAVNGLSSCQMTSGPIRLGNHWQSCLGARRGGCSVLVPAGSDRALPQQ